MGISTYQSYCGAQIFEAIGLNVRLRRALLHRHGRPRSKASASRKSPRKRCAPIAAAFGSDPVLANMLDIGGEYAFRMRGEEHMWTPDAIAKLQHATRSGKSETYKEYATLINDQSKRHMTLRGLFEIKPAGPPVPLEEVESGQGNRQALRHRRDVARAPFRPKRTPRWRSP